jgi:hypothetical protein
MQHTVPSHSYTLYSLLVGLDYKTTKPTRPTHTTAALDHHAPTTYVYT